MMEPVPDSLIKMPEVIGALSLAKAGSRVLLADCCRDMPNRARGRNLGLGANFKTSDLPLGTVVLFGCKPGEKALEQDDWKHGAFSLSLIEEINKLAALGTVTTGSLADRVKSKVRKLTNDRQNPIPFSFDSVDLLLTPESPEDSDYLIGLDLYHGKEQKIDQIRALRYFRKAAVRSHPVACAYVGQSYYFQWGENSFDAVAATDWYRRAFPKLTQLAESGDAEAQVALGRALRYGLGITANRVDAVKWFRSAADQNNTDAMVELGSCFESGIGGDQDTDEMLRLYRKAAERNNAHGIYCLSNAYFFGIGVSKDRSEALKWMERATQAGYSKAYHDLAHSYENGEQVKKDAKRAFELIKQAYDLGDGRSISCFATYYFKGSGTAKDEARGLEILLKAASSNDAIQLEIAKRIRQGDGVQANAEKAMDWEKTVFETRLKGAKAGVPMSQHDIAECYLDGIGTEKNRPHALKWGDTWRKTQTSR